FQDAKVQHGTVGFGGTDTTKTASLTEAILPDKTWMLFSYRTNGDPADMDQDLIRGVITDGNTLTFDRTTAGSTVNLTWYTIEFLNGTTIQHGSTNLGSSSNQANETITAVDTSKTIVSAGGFGYSGGKTSYTADDNIGPGTTTLNLTS